MLLSVHLVVYVKPIHWSGTSSSVPRPYGKSSPARSLNAYCPLARVGSLLVVHLLSLPYFDGLSHLRMLCQVLAKRIK